MQELDQDPPSRKGWIKLVRSICETGCIDMLDEHDEKKKKRKKAEGAATEPSD